MSMHPGRKLPALACFSLLWLGVGASSARAQAIHEGRLTGTITGEDRAVIPGATVEISSPALLGAAGRKTATTSARGTYVFLNLPVGTYTVSASMTGFKTMVRGDIGITPDAALTLDFVLPVGAITETITVTAEGPIVDTKTSTIDSKIDKDLLAKLPTSRDAFYDLTLTTPGMVEGSGGGSLPSPTAYGSSTNENVFLINGVNATNPEAGSFGTLVNVNYDAVEEVRVVALGSKAEYGSYSGAAIDVLTKSGSNDFHGSAAFYSLLGSPASNQPKTGADLGAPWLYVGEGEQLAGETKSDWEGNATLGGPIVKDKLWFFAAFDYLRNSSLPPRWSLETKSRGLYLDGKITAAPFAAHRAWLSYHYENNDSSGASWGSEPAWDTSMSYGNKVVNHTVSAQWQWFPTGTTTASAKFLGFWKTDKPYLPSDAPNHPGYINWWKWSDYGINGAFPYLDAQKANRQTIQADLSHYAEGFLGEHDIKFGAQYTRGRGDRAGGYFQNYVNFLYPYRWTQNVQEMQDWYGDTGLMFYNYRDTLNPFLTVRTADSWGAFLDDQWAVNNRLTVNLGLRFDWMTTKYGKGAVYELATSATEINDPPPLLRDRASTDNVFDFKTVAPRVGLTYKLTEDGKTVARAAYGRYYMPLSLEYLRRFGPDMPPVSRLYQMFEVGPWNSVDTNGDGVIDSIETRNAARRVYGMTPFSEEARTVDYSWTLNVADNLKDQYTDQITLNFERELARNFSVSASYIYKHTANIFANVPINRETGQEWEYERIPFTTSTGRTVQLYSIVLKDYNGDGVADSNDIQWIGDHNTSMVVNMPSYDGIQPKRDYHGLQLVFNKRYSDRWQALASFLYSSSSGVGRRTMRQDVNVEGPMFWDDNWMGSLNYTIDNLEGPLPFTPKYEVKLSGSYKIPKLDVDLGLRLRVHSGRPMWLTESYPQHTQWAEPEGGVIDPGGLGRIVAVDPTQPDYLPTQALVDLHLEKAFKLGENKTVHLVVDGFNVFNAATPSDVDIQFEWGKVTSIPAPRRLRAGLRFQF